MGKASGTYERCIQNLIIKPEGKKPLHVEDVEHNECMGCIQLALGSPGASCCLYIMNFGLHKNEEFDHLGD
jgi:hypothetical protein